MKKRKRIHTAFGDLQLEVGRLQQENEDLRAEKAKLTRLIVDLQRQYGDKIQELQTKSNRLQTLADHGIKIPSIDKGA